MKGPKRHTTGEHQSCVLTGTRITEGPVRLFLLAPAPVTVGDRSRVAFTEYGGVDAMFVPFALPLEGFYNGHHVLVRETEHAAFLARRLGAPAQEVACMASHVSSPRATRAVDRVIARVARYAPRLAWDGALRGALATEESWHRFGVCGVTPDLLRGVRSARAIYRRRREMDRLLAQAFTSDRQRSFSVVADTTPAEVVHEMLAETYAMRSGGAYTATAAPRPVPEGIAQTHCDGTLHVLVTAEGPGMHATSFSLAPCTSRGVRESCNESCISTGLSVGIVWTPDIYRVLADHRERAALGRFQGAGLPGITSPEMRRVYREALTARFADLYAATTAFFGVMECAGRRLAPSPSYGAACDMESMARQVQVFRSAHDQIREERRAWQRP